MTEPTYVEQPDFIYWECDECGFDAVTKVSSATKLAPICPLCAGDTGRDVVMRSRIARDTDKVEGKDARKNTAP